ncbi:MULTISPECIES: hypothetical protein [Cohnella]|uniref:hypothetical protein n=1 Tax=Cohnella TaxID=329857 RepID=UPI0009BBAC4D|nr:MULTISPECIES: hypothetical protein [Cohnella]MBN2983870.1 hypothetical protein [Cohnella algarum]
MPYVLRNRVNGELLSHVRPGGEETARLMLWSVLPNEDEKLEGLERSGKIALLPENNASKGRHAAEWELVQEIGRWQPVELREEQTKLADALLLARKGRSVYMRNDELVAE